MDESGEPQDSDSEQVVEVGETYSHDNHGDVDVTGIWQGVHQVNSAHHKTETDVIIVRFSTDREGREVELTDTLDEFPESIE